MGQEWNGVEHLALIMLTHPQLGPAQFRGIAALLNHERDSDALMSLAARPELPSDVLDQLARHPDAQVAVGALEHPSLVPRLPDLIASANVSRLVELASFTSSPALLSAVAAHPKCRSFRVRLALLDNRDLPGPVALELLGELERTWESVSDANQFRVFQLLPTFLEEECSFNSARLTGEELDELLASLSSEIWIEQVLEHAFPHTRWTARFLARITAPALELGEDTPQLRTALSRALAHESYLDHAHAAAVSAAAAARGMSPTLLRSLAHRTELSRTQVIAALERMAIPGLAPRLDIPEYFMLAWLARLPTYQALLEALEVARSPLCSRDARPVVAAALFSHPLADAQLRERCVPLLDDSAAENLVNSWEESWGEDLLIEIFAQFPYTCDAVDLELLSSPGALSRLVRALLARTPTNPGGLEHAWWAEALLRCCDRPEFPPALSLELPAQIVLGDLRSHPQYEAEERSIALAPALEQARASLGADPGAWLSAVALLESFPGTTAELCAVVDAMISPARLPDA